MLAFIRAVECVDVWGECPGSAKSEAFADRTAHFSALTTFCPAAFISRFMIACPIPFPEKDSE